MNIQGQAALVTGGGSGLGEATARELARLGAKVAVLDINLANAQQVAADIGGVAIQCDITDGASLQGAIEQAAAAHGPARILAHIAGIGAAKRVIGKDGNAAPLEDFPQVADASPEEADIFGRVRNQKRAVVTCRIDGLPDKVCYFIKNTVDHSVPLAYPYAIYEVSPGSHVYNLYPYMHEDTSMDEIVRNVYHLARRLGGTRAKLLSHPMVWKWFPYFSVEDFRAGIYDRIAKLQGQNHTYFVGELLAGQAGIALPAAIEDLRHGALDYRRCGRTAPAFRSLQCQCGAGRGR